MHLGYRQDNQSFVVLYRKCYTMIDVWRIGDKQYYQASLEGKDTLYLFKEPDENKNPVWISMKDSRHALAREIGELIEAHSRK